MSQEPSKEQSAEADGTQLRLAADEGANYQESLRYMVEEVADTGATTRAGDFEVGIAVEEAEGMYHFRGEGDLQWEEPAADDNCHLEVAVSDAADGRFVPELDVTATLVSGSGQQVGPVEVPFVWHPGLYHYGTNLSVPDRGSYTVRVHVEPPVFHRHDETNGDRYAEAVSVEFEGVEFEPGRE